jgi:hypothetical protein
VRARESYGHPLREWPAFNPPATPLDRLADRFEKAIDGAPPILVGLLPGTLFFQEFYLFADTGHLFESPMPIVARGRRFTILLASVKAKIVDRDGLNQLRRTSMYKGSMVIFMLRLAAGGVALVSGPLAATAAEGSASTPGLYQIQPAGALGQPGTSAVWRLNTSTGALDFCTFNGVTTGGAAHITCQASPPIQNQR